MSEVESDERGTADGGSRQVISVDFSPLHLNRESVMSREVSTALRRFDDSAILYSPGNRVSLVANPSVAALWDCFDGTASLGHIADDVSAVFSLEAEQAWNDVYSLARDLMTAGLLADSVTVVDPPNQRESFESDPASLAGVVLPDPPNR